MLNGGMGTDFVINHNGADGISLQFAPDHDGGDTAFFKIGEDIDVYEQPVGKHDERFHAAVEQHLQIAFEAAAFVMNVGEDGQIRRLVKRILDAPQDQSAIRVCHVEN